jgi:hypothetical protein
VTAAKCEVCYGARWVVRVATFRDGKGQPAALDGRAVPFQRSNWFQVGELLCAALLASKALQPCVCNAKKLSPWHPSWGEGNGSNAQASEAPF